MINLHDGRVLGIVIGLLIVAFISGRYSTQASPTTDIKSTQILNTQKQTDKDTHERTVTTIVKEPTGKTVTRTVTTKDTETRTDADINKTTQTETETHPIKKPLNISAIIAIDHLKPAYEIGRAHV